MAEKNETPRPRKYDLSNLNGISEAREEVFSGMMAGNITEQRAIAAEKMLRGQTMLKGELPLKFLSMITGNKKFEAYAQDLAISVSGFVSGKVALPSGE